MKLFLKIISCLIFAFMVWNFFVGHVIFNYAHQIDDRSMLPSYEPFSLSIQSDEGYSKIKLDENGFNNDLNLSKHGNLIIVEGDSHTQALQVARGENFCSIAQSNLNNNSEYAMYNVGFSGGDMADYIFYGRMYLDKFKPRKVIIQVSTDDFTTDAVNTSKGHIVKGKEGYAIQSMHKKTNLERVKTSISSITPFTTLILNKISKSAPMPKPFLPVYNKESASEDYNLNEYMDMIDWEVKQTKKIYQDKAVFLLLSHEPYIDQGGEVSFTKKVEDSTRSLILVACKKYNIDVIDVHDAFINLYKENNIFPCGFENTIPGSGHINKYGHEIVGKALAHYLNSH